jgi:hypothetical protein
MATRQRCQKRAAGAPGRVVDEIGYESKERGVRWWQRGERRAQRWWCNPIPDVVLAESAARPSFEVAQVWRAGSGLRANSRPNCFFVTFYSQKPIDWCCAVFLPASRIGRWYSCVTDVY